MNRHAFLGALHAKVRPRTYLEIGVNNGKSLQLSRVPSIGIDPEYAVTSELQADIQLSRTTSDEFFARRDPMAHLPGRIVDLAFIDGMHLAEYALRDFLAIERFTETTSVLIFDDMLPRSVAEANRKRTTKDWTGDVYKAAQALRDLRPDLVVIEVDTAPTGTAVVLCPDATRHGVLPGYDDWLEATVVADPQVVPDELLTRSRALSPGRLLASQGWGRLLELREGARPATAQQVRDGFADVLSSTNGS